MFRKGKNHEMVSGLFVAGVAMAITGLCWDMVFPINKKNLDELYTLYTFRASHHHDCHADSPDRIHGQA